MTIRPATPADTAGIGIVQDASPESSHWLPAEYLQYNCSVAVENGTIVGFLVSRPIGDDREILNLAVHPDFRLRGIARALIRHELQSPARGWFLEVRESNAAARRLYERCGFVEVGTRQDYYHNPQEPGIVMSFLS
jgi:ribosomal-protein-alanine acetyltransferase